MNRIPALQGLRALAVVIVVIYHAWPGLLPGGYLGVDVFFVISGFLITGLLMRELESTGTLAFSEFYARRVRRLTPALVVVVGTVMIVSWAFHAPVERKILTSAALATLAYISNVWYASLATDYLDESAHDNALLHSWSLSVEEQFYLAWPAILWVLYRMGARPSRRRLVLGLGVLMVVSFGVCLWSMTWAQPWAFFGSHTRAWEFGAGALTALLTGRVIEGLAGQPFQWLALAALGLSAATFSVASPHPGWITLLPVFASCVLLLGLSQPKSPTSRLLSLKPARWLGDVSYSLYLWHWPVLLFVRDLLRIDTPLAIAGAVALSLVLAQLSYVLVEEPLRHHPKLIGHPFRSLATMGLTLVACMALVGGVRVQSTRSARAAEQKRYADAARDRPSVYAANCHADYFDTSPRPCEGGRRSSSRITVLLGDSHAAQWFPALDRLSEKQGRRLVSLTKSGCPVLIVEPVDARLGRSYTECTRWGEGSLELIAGLQPETVVVSVSRTYVDRRAGEDLVAWRAGAGRLVERLRRIAGRVVILADTPRPGFPVPNCLARADWRSVDGGRTCAFPTARESDVAARMWPATAVRGDSVRLVPVASLVCRDEPCPVERDHLVLYADSNHLTASFSASLADNLGASIDAAFAAESSSVGRSHTSQR